MAKMWQHGYNLVLMSASRDQRADRAAASQVMEQLKFVLYPNWAASNINLFNGDKPALRLTALLLAQC